MDWWNFVNDIFEKDRIELRLWRERYPHMANVIREKALAEIENREPDYGPTQVRG